MPSIIRRNAIRGFLSGIRRQRGQVILVGDSNTYGVTTGARWGHWCGVIDGLYALLGAAGVWGSGLVSCSQPGTDATDYWLGMNHNNWAATTGAGPVMTAAWDLSAAAGQASGGRNKYAWLASPGTVSAGNCFNFYTAPGHPMLPGDPLTWRAWVGGGESGTPGSFRPSARLEQNPFTDQPMLPVATYTASDGVVEMVTRTLAASAARNANYAGYGFGTTGVNVDAVGDLFATFSSIENNLRTKGIACSVLSGIGGYNSKQMLDDLLAIPLTSLAHFLTCSVAPLEAPYPTCVAVNFGQNCINGTATLSVDGVNMTSSVLGQAANVAAITARIRAAWAAAGLSAYPLYFLIIPSHVNLDTATDATGGSGVGLNHYRDYLPTLCAQIANAAGVDARGIMTAAVTRALSGGAAGGFASDGVAHLHKVAYIEFWTRIWRKLLASGGGRSQARTRDRFIRQAA